VADPGAAEGLVDGEPVGHAVTEAGGHDPGELGQVQGGVPVGPAPTVLEHLGQVPVVEGHERADSGLQQRVDQAVVEADPLLVDAAVALRQHSGPRDREPVGVDLELAHELDVRRPPVVVVAGDLTGVTVVDGPRDGAEGVPDGR